ncbi:hypothetical protein CF038_26365 [Klebsiella michiganensis]|uniref:Uncharacterized protein n=1 Tax=Klebsiella michiganensis TaxID=1134687 RepID=A0A249WIG8_9ENTR|nr:hypothetical protein CF000_14990 [Klebsiella michiganensis]AUV90004.1 hypothetical protein C2U44_02430 [Klebsiella oxytoca]ASZ56478.1 hypothetical protein CKQ55_15210 [Klebsiella michiganensis]AUV97727.1 hypothetical protein C2U46_08615 [Klebsiella oxytoca]AUW11517.1 hypothetical protein C2U42_20860 [Klebsiella oxytoca]
MLICHYDNVVSSESLNRAAMVAQNEDDTQSHSGCVGTQPLHRPPEDVREGKDVSDSESFAAVCPPRISGFRGQPGFA